MAPGKHAVEELERIVSQIQARWPEVRIIVRGDLILHDLRRIALAGTGLARAQVSTIRSRLLKIGAIVTVSVRRVYVSLSGVFPL